MLLPRLVLFAALDVLLAQTPEFIPSPQFDVAAIKPSLPGVSLNQRSYGNNGHGKYVAKNTPLHLMIAQAYEISAVHVLGGPAWIRSDGYEVTARADVTAEEEEQTPRTGTPPTFERDRLRLRALLEDRFNLKVHRETRELPVLAVTIAKGGPKLQPPNCVTFDQNQPPVIRPDQARPAYCGTAPYQQNAAAFKITGSGVTMAELIRSLSTFSDQPLVDRTGYTQKFNATVEWYVEPIKSPGSDDRLPQSADPPGPSLITALQQQLGLKLESAKGPIEVLVVDKVERPSENF